MLRLKIFWLNVLHFISLISFRWNIFQHFLFGLCFSWEFDSIINLIDYIHRNEHIHSTPNLLTSFDLNAAKMLTSITLKWCSPQRTNKKVDFFVLIIVSGLMNNRRRLPIFFPPKYRLCIELGLRTSNAVNIAITPPTMMSSAFYSNNRSLALSMRRSRYTQCKTIHSSLVMWSRLIEFSNRH